MRCASRLRSKFYSGTLRTIKMLFGIGVVSILLINIPGSPECLAADVYGKRLDPPHIYFVHSSICKSGVTSGIKGQENFLRYSTFPEPVRLLSGANIEYSISNFEV